MFERLFEKAVGFPSLMLFKSRLDWHLPEDGVSVADSVLGAGEWAEWPFWIPFNPLFFWKNKKKITLYSLFRSSYIWVMNLIIKKGELKGTFFFFVIARNDPIFIKYFKITNKSDITK